MIPSILALVLSTTGLSEISDLEKNQDPQKKYTFPFQTYEEAKKFQALFVAATVISVCTLLVAMGLIFIPGSFSKDDTVTAREKLARAYIGFECLSFIALLSMVILLIKQCAQVGGRNADIALVVVLTIASGGYLAYFVRVLYKRVWTDPNY
jgi:hypothetical protein